MSKQFPLFNELVAFVIERHRVYLKKQAGKPKPWTTDPILQQFRFTCAYRELDAVTVWIRENWREPYESDPNVWFSMIVARLINWPESLNELFDSVFDGKKVRWLPATFTKMADARKRAGQKLFSSAYMIHADATPTSSKAGYLAECVLTPIWNTRKDARKHTGSLADFHAWLMTFRDMGSFMAAQVVADVKYTPLLKDAEDWWTWAAPGPGSQKGLNLVMGRDANAPWKAADWLANLQQLREQLNPKLVKAGMQPLHAQDTQSIAGCEFFKYKRGYSRNKYPGGA